MGRQARLIKRRQPVTVWCELIPLTPRPCLSFIPLNSPFCICAIHFPSHSSISSAACKYSRWRTWVTTSQCLGQTGIQPSRHTTNSNYCGDAWDNAIGGDKEVYYCFNVFKYVGHFPTPPTCRQFPSQWTRLSVLSDTFAHSGVRVESVSSGTFTLEASKGVDARSPLAQARQLLTLIDVCRGDKELEENFSTGMSFRVVVKAATNETRCYQDQRALRPRLFTLVVKSLDTLVSLTHYML